MSKTFTSRPAVTRGRGRGRGNQSTGTNTMNARPPGSESQNRGRGQTGPGYPLGGASRGTQPSIRGGRLAPSQAQTSDAATESGTGEQELGQRMSYQGGYTMITPNEKKRQQISQMAQKETEAYNAHKQQNTPSSFSYVGTAGGGQISQAASRQKLVQTSPNKAQRLAAQHERKSFMKQKEDVELQQKKDEQRRKAQQNEERKKAEEQQDKNKWDQQRRVTNEAFLRRLENQRPAGHQPGSQSTSGTQQRQTTQLPMPASNPVNIEGAVGGYNDTADDTDTIETLSGEQRQRLTALAAIFPQYSQQQLLTILEHVGFSLDAAVNLLQD